jgi:hypothetical protein
MKKITIATGILITLLLAAVSSFAQTQSREDILKELTAKRAELIRLEKALLLPSEEDQAAYADFLKQPDTGLIRLLPREDYDCKMISNVRGGGSYYSFTERTHEYGGSDIGLEQGYLKTGFAGANYGMLTNLGDVPLEDVSLKTTAINTLALHNVATEEPQARIEQRRWSDGTIVDGATFKDRVPLKANSTYLLRAILYSSHDCLVAFRVVRIDSDGSAIILWKLLKKYPKPYLARN